MSTLAAPKQRNAPKTRAKILEAAQQAFAEVGYAQAGIRDIAARADVSSTLLLRYYGSKAGLFEAAMIEAMPVTDLFTHGRENFGEHVASQLFDPAVEVKPPAMLALASGDPEAQEIASRVSEQYAVAPLAKWLGGADAQARALAIVSLSMGVAMCTRQFPMARRAKSVDKKLQKWLATELQRIVDQS